LRLTASDGDKSATDTVLADIVDTYRVELKAWIPHDAVLDPYSLDEPWRFPRALVPTLGEPVRSCIAGAFPPAGGPASTVQITSSRFAGDSHRGYGAFNTNSPDYRIRTIVEFDFDGERIRHFVTETGYGLTTRVVRVQGSRGTVTCRQEALADPAFAKIGSVDGDRSFNIDLAGYDPLVPRVVASWGLEPCRQILEISRVWAAACALLLDVVPLTPSIDGHARGTVLADGSVGFTFTTDFFPSFGLAVRKNQQPHWSGVINDASCIGVLGYAGAGRLVVRLNGDLPRNVGAFSADTPDLPCDPAVLSRPGQALATALRVTVNPATQPVLLVLNSHLPEG
jgi:hypothetical protein